VAELKADQLYHRCDPQSLDFESTDQLEPLEEVIGQPRAVEAVAFGMDVEREGFNLFVLGPPGVGKRTLVQQMLERRRDGEPTSDLCYVNNFEQPHQPTALMLPAGKGCAFRDEMDQLIDDVLTALSQAFESDEYREQRQALEQEFGQQQKEKIEQLQEKAKQRGLALIRTPQGMGFAPMDAETGKPMEQEKLQQLSDEQKQELQQAAEQLQQEAQQLMQDAPRDQREAQRKLKDLNERFAEEVIDPLVDDIKSEWSDDEKIPDYLDDVRSDLVENAPALLEIAQKQEMLPGAAGSAQQPQQAGPRGSRQQQGGGPGQSGGPQQGPVQAPMPQKLLQSPLLRRYRVNVLVDRSGEPGRPVIYEDNPTYPNLIGRTEHMAQMGALITDFNLIKPGAMHRANGGYLVVEARRLLMQPLVWEALKRALRSEELRIESPGEAMGMISTVRLEPEPVPLNIKVLVLGDRLLYYKLRELDPDFAELFKVAADFEDDMDRDDGSQRDYARLISTVAQKEKLRPFDRSAVARLIEQGSRIAGDSEKLSIHMRRVADLLREADYWAGRDDGGDGKVTADHVDRAIEKQIFRSDRMRERLHEEIERGTLLIDVDGEQAGQVNALSVFPFGDYLFGRPNRVTARVRLGKGEVIDIEREVELGGPLHSKGVLILAGFLSGRYATDLPLSLAASLVFEQSYGGIGGDSASTAELCALLSAVADLPVKQSLAITGSVNQHGRVQPIGAVNEKIEGFFDVCRRIDLTGQQGVIIPQANVRHLMLRQDVIDAVERGRFHIHAVKTVNDAMELLTGLDAGEADQQGRYPDRSVNGKVRAALRRLAEHRRKFAAAFGGDGDGDRD